MSKASKSDLDASSFNGTDSSSLEPADHASKHDKLVQDYVKLRSKLTVLKKAYVEQTELSAKKDQTIRKFELEIEALAFRNQQLSARVQSLQQELDERSVGAAAAPPSPAKPSAQLLAEELHQKIEENQSLHRQLNELEVDLRHKIARGQESLKQVEYEKMLLDKKLQALELSSKTSIEGLQNDKMKLELSIIQLEDQLRSTHLEKEQLMRQESEHNLLAASQPAEPPKVNHKHHTNLQNNLKTSYDTLHQIYCSVEELFAQKPKVCKSASKCASLLSQIANCFTDSKLAHTDPILSEFLASNHHMLSLIIEDLVRSHQHQEMDRLNKKIKIYINKLDQFLCEDENSFAQVLTNTFHSFRTGTLLATSDNLALQIKHLIDLLEKLLFSLNEKLGLKYSLDYSADLTTLDECLVSHIAQFKQSLCSLSSSSGLVESIVQLGAHFCAEQNGKVDAAEIQELKKMLEQKEMCIGELETRCKEWQSKCDHREADIAQLRSKLHTEKSWLQGDNLDEMDKHLEQPTVQLYQSQLESVNKQMQFLDSKAVYYYDEMVSLIERLRLQMNINDVQSHELSEIKDQLERTRSSYEMQISTMSDHLIEVTERMTKQDEENEKLKHELEMVCASKSAKAKRTK